MNTVEQNKQRYMHQTKLEEDSEIERFRAISKSVKTIPDVTSDLINPHHHLISKEQQQQPTSSSSITPQMNPTIAT